MIIVTGGSGMVGRFLQDIWKEPVYLSSKDYDLTKENEQKKCFHYSNLRPLKVSINRSHKLESLKKD